MLFSGNLSVYSGYFTLKIDKDISSAIHYWTNNKSTLEIHDIAVRSLETKRLSDETTLKILP